MMDNTEINKILRSYNKTRGVFIGTYPSDQIPFSDRYPYALVINTDDSSKKGTHWVAVYVINPKTIEYFDSFAEEPIGNIAQYLSLFSKVIKNVHSLQSIASDNCGKFAIFFIIERSSGKSFEQIVQLLRNQLDRNKYLDNYLKRIKRSINNGHFEGHY